MPTANGVLADGDLSGCPKLLIWCGLEPYFEPVTPVVPALPKPVLLFVEVIVPTGR
jgi:hypothetical protein